MNTSLTKLPRLYTDLDLQKSGIIELSDKQSHYLKNVLRRTSGDTFRVFNGRDGEFLAQITELKKKSGQAKLTETIKAHPKARLESILLFAPLKKHRMDVLIEKAVELGVSTLIPVITKRTEVRKINAERIKAQIIEAAEQCERLTITDLKAPVALPAALSALDKSIPLYAAIERGEFESLDTALKPGAAAFLIGPVGGFDDEEIVFLKTQDAVKPVSLGNHVLRAETASIVCMAIHAIKNT